MKWVQTIAMLINAQRLELIIKRSKHKHDDEE